MVADQEAHAKDGQGAGVTALSGLREPVDRVLVPPLIVEAGRKADLGADVAGASPVFENLRRHRGATHKKKAGLATRLQIITGLGSN